MEKSALQIARAAYQPKLPKALQGPVKVKEGAATQSVGNQEEIKALFPNTYGMPVVEFVPAESENKEAINVGIILSGGQAPGGHNVISGLYDGVKSLNKNSKLYGFLMGPGGLVDHKYVEFTDEFIDEYRNTGGFDIIGSGRTKLEKEAQFESGIQILRELGIKALVIIGGDDSNTNACVLAEYYAAKKYGVQVIGCPKTIDGDLKNEQIAFVMSNITAENKAVLESLPADVKRQLCLDRDPHGNVQVSLIETEKLLSAMVADKLAAWKKEGKFNGKFSAQHHFFGYEGRCAAPSNYDADYCYSLGYNASRLISNGKTGYMSVIKNTTAPAAEWIAGGVPITMMMNIERRNGANKPVIRKALVELDGAPFKFFASKRDEWARQTAYVYPGPIQYFGPTEVCDQCTKTLALEQK